jgi:FtsP/CotA-like multicopper oxidase with cupredoxin domain
MRRITALIVGFVLAPTLVASYVAASPRVNEDQSALPNDNRTPAGTHVGDTLVLRLTVAPVVWRILGDSNPGFKLLAFAEEGKTATIPGPLIRVRAGTPIRAIVRNPLADTLVVRGLSEHGGPLDSVVILPNTTGAISFVAGRAGTYQYWGTMASAHRGPPPAVPDPGLVRTRYDSQLAGAFIVDPPGAVAHDRIFVITEIADYAAPSIRRDHHGIPEREFTALNGRSWPYTERLRYSVGDSVRWRIINTTFQSHPMHLHGFYFRVDSHGSARANVDSIYSSGQRRMAATEVIGIGENISLVFSPDRPGGWVFHCHLTNHASLFPRVDQESDMEYPIAHDHGDPNHHFVNGMNGLILGITVTGNAHAPAPWHPSKRLRLFVQSDSASGNSVRHFGYVLQRGAEPRRDSVEIPGPVLFLTRGEPTSIEVVNRTNEPTSVHWHAIELESYYDGAVGWSRSSTRTEPAILPDSTFEVHITPKRAGTFMYHTHYNEMRQQFGGLVGAIIVLEPGEHWDAARELLFVISDDDKGGLRINGSSTPPVRELHRGTTYRIRIADIAAFRQNLITHLLRDSTLFSWRPVAKDGFTLPPNQATIRPSIARVSSGETADFEFTPENDGDLTFQIGVLLRTEYQVQGQVKLQVH